MSGRDVLQQDIPSSQGKLLELWSLCDSRADALLNI